MPAGDVRGVQVGDLAGGVHRRVMAEMVGQYSRKGVAGADRIAAAGGLDINVFEPSQFEEERFGGLMGVAAGSHQPAAMIVLRHEPADPKGFIAIVGKGIVFDSGGLSLKPPAGMEAMKTDMSGAAVVLATMQAIAALELPVRVVGVTPVTENMPGGGAQRRCTRSTAYCSPMSCMIASMDGLGAAASVCWSRMATSPKNTLKGEGRGALENNLTTCCSLAGEC